MRLVLVLLFLCLVASVLSMVPKTQESPSDRRSFREREEYSGPGVSEDTERELRRRHKNQRRYLMKKLRSHLRTEAPSNGITESPEQKETEHVSEKKQGRHNIRHRLSEMLKKSRNPAFRDPAVAGHIFGGISDGWQLNIRNIFGGSDQDWWKGPNVCVDREEREEELLSSDEKPITPHSVYTSAKCTEVQSSFKCETIVIYGGQKKVMTTKYECCHGYSRKSTEFGCPREINLKDLLETAEEAGLSELVEAVDSVGLDDLLMEGNYTIFAPTNQAFDEYIPKDEPFESNIVLISPETLGMVDALSDTLSNHVVQGFVKSSDFSDEGLLKTAHPYGEIRINIYDVPEKLVTANCVPIVSTDHIATNGVIHEVDGVLTPVTDTIIGIVSKNRELEVLKSMLGKTGLSTTLKKDGQFTLLAPTDSAFKKMSKSLRDRLTINTGCLENVLKSHLLPHVVCSSILKGQVRTVNMLGNYLHVNRTEDDKLYIEGFQVTATDIMASNGVIHLIEDVIIPQESKDIFDIAKQEGAEKALSLINEAGLTKTIQTMENFTIFIPTDQAIENLPEDIKTNIRRDRRALASLLKYHIVPKELQQRDIYHMRELPSLSEDKTIRVRQYSTFPFGWKTQMTIGCAPIVKTSLDSCSGTAYIIDQVMLPPEESVLDVLYKDSRFSTIVSLLKKAEMAEALQDSNDITIFAPNDEAFKNVDQDALSKIKEDKEKLKKFLQHHVMIGSLCCSGIFERATLPWLGLRERTLDGSNVKLNRNGDTVSVDNSEVVSCDHQAKNGIVHQIDRVLDGAFERYGSKEKTETPRRNHFWTVARNIDDVWEDLDLDFDWDFGWDRKK